MRLLCPDPGAHSGLPLGVVIKRRGSMTYRHDDCSRQPSTVEGSHVFLETSRGKNKNLLSLHCTHITTETRHLKPHSSLLTTRAPHLTQSTSRLTPDISHLAHHTAHLMAHPPNPRLTPDISLFAHHTSTLSLGKVRGVRREM